MHLAKTQLILEENFTNKLTNAHMEKNQELKMGVMGMMEKLNPEAADNLRRAFEL